MFRHYICFQFCSYVTQAYWVYIRLMFICLSYLSLSLLGCGKEVVCWLSVLSFLITVGFFYISDVVGASRATSSLNDVTRFLSKHELSQLVSEMSSTLGNDE